MAIVVIMPKQGQSVESCIITEIKKNEGDIVKKGEILFTYETDKASFEEESPADGTLLKSFYGEGDEVPVLDNMMVIGDPGEDYSDLIGKQETDEDKLELNDNVDSTEKIETEDASPVIKKTAVEQNNQTQFISPRAKKLANKESAETSNIAGTGPKGRVIEEDVKQFLKDRPRMTPLAKKVASEEGLQPQDYGTGLAGAARANDLSAAYNSVYGVEYEDKKLSNMRKIIAKAMHSSLQNSAQLTHHLAADARRLLELRKKVKLAVEAKSIEANITINDMVCLAVVKALKKFPEVNTHFLGDSKRYFNKVHLGLAVDTERGLMVPVIRDADDLSLIGLSNRLKVVAESCRKGNVNPDILAPEAGTFTVSNLGNYGVEMFTPVINLPQSAILGVNTIIPRPKDLGDGVYAFVPHIGLSLTYDHRSLDGGEATRFLKQIAIEIENLQLDITL